MLSVELMIVITLSLFLLGILVSSEVNIGEKLSFAGKAFAEKANDLSCSWISDSLEVNQGTIEGIACNSISKSFSENQSEFGKIVVLGTHYG